MTDKAEAQTPLTLFTVRSEHLLAHDGTATPQHGIERIYLAAEVESVLAEMETKLKDARYLAKVLVSAWDDDARPPSDVCERARKLEVDQR